jgi:hypothetical protein
VIKLRTATALGLTIPPSLLTGRIARSNEAAPISPPVGSRAALDPIHHIDHRGVKPVLRRPLQMRRQIARDGWWN